MVQPKKHLGQHFLTDKNIARKITELISDESLPLLEIGPGTGVLTQFLAPRFQSNLHLVEIDSESVAFLKEKFPTLVANIHHCDFLETNLLDICPSPFRVVGNFPYNISSPILFKIIENRESIPMVVGMFQKEVAERIAAKPNNKQYGILSVWTQLFYKVNYCFTVPEHLFFPPPTVKSGVITLTRIHRDLNNLPPEFILQVIKTAFNQRRKTLRNSLKSINVKEIDLPEFSKRPEQLCVEDFIQLAEKLYNRE
mgnify:CR=1 FL=1